LNLVKKSTGIKHPLQNLLKNHHALCPVKSSPN